MSDYSSRNSWPHFPIRQVFKLADWLAGYNPVSIVYVLKGHEYIERGQRDVGEQQSDFADGLWIRSQCGTDSGCQRRQGQIKD